jgi:DNA-binding NarL/FixJ family response regulator
VAPLPTPQVLLGNLEPIMALGLRRQLSDDGIEVVGHEDEAVRLLRAVQELRPDTVVLDLNHGGARALADQVRLASPHTKVVLWARDETVMEVLDPDESTTRLVAVTTPEGLCRELLGSTRHRVEE